MLARKAVERRFATGVGWSFPLLICAVLAGWAAWNRPANIRATQRCPRRRDMAAQRLFHLLNQGAGVAN